MRPNTLLKNQLHSRPTGAELSPYLRQTIGHIRSGQLLEFAMDASPTVIEPTTSSNRPLPKIPYLSPQPSSSSDSFDSSRPSSQPSSTTSQSVSPSPIPKSVPAIDTHECIELPALPSNPSLPNNTSAGQSQRQTEPVQPDSAVNTRTNNEASRHPRLGYLIRTGNWLTNTLGALNLALTLVGMIVFGRITMLAARNDLIGTCSQWASVSRSTLDLVQLSSNGSNPSVGREEHRSELQADSSIKQYGRDYANMEILETDME